MHYPHAYCFRTCQEFMVKIKANSSNSSYFTLLYHLLQMVTVLQAGLFVDSGVMNFILIPMTTELGRTQKKHVKKDIIPATSAS